MALSCAHINHLLHSQRQCLALTLPSLHLCHLPPPPEPLRSRCGPWAVVTGATDGIALAFALHLARSNLSLVLVGRNSLKLQSTSAEILSKFPNSKIQIVVIDFSGDLVGGVENLIESDLGGDLGEQCWGFVPLR